MESTFGTGKGGDFSGLQIQDVDVRTGGDGVVEPGHSRKDNRIPVHGPGGIALVVVVPFQLPGRTAIGGEDVDIPGATGERGHEDELLAVGRPVWHVDLHGREG